MKKPKLGLPPTRASSTSLKEMIGKGGSVASDAAPVPAAPPVEDKLKSFTFKIYESELAQIRTIQDALAHLTSSPVLPCLLPTQPDCTPTCSF